MLLGKNKNNLTLGLLEGYITICAASFQPINHLLKFNIGQFCSRLINGLANSPTSLHTGELQLQEVFKNLQ